MNELEAEIKDALLDGSIVHIELLDNQFLVRLIGPGQWESRATGLYKAPLADVVSKALDRYRKIYD